MTFELYLCVKILDASLRELKPNTANRGSNSTGHTDMNYYFRFIWMSRRGFIRGLYLHPDVRSVSLINLGLTFFVTKKKQFIDFPWFRRYKLQRRFSNFTNHRIFPNIKLVSFIVKYVTSILKLHKFFFFLLKHNCISFHTLNSNYHLKIRFWSTFPRNA